MKKFLKLFLVTSALCVGVFFIFFSRGQIAAIFSKSSDFSSGLFRENTDKRKIIELQAEVERLRAESASFEKYVKVQGVDTYHYKIAEVYSRYPFNDQSTVVLNVGSEDGIREGMPIFLERGVLFGKVRKVSRTQSEAETIFNPLWKTSVSVGASGVKGVYVGGTVPTLDFIPKDAKIAVGDVVMNVSPDVPLHATLGTVSEIDSSSYEVWQRAKISPAFDPDLFRTVLVLVDFP